jgi:hypothetical protein
VPAVVLAHRDQPVGADEEVDLLEVGGVGHHEGVARVVLELGPLLALAHVLQGQGVEGELLLDTRQVVVGRLPQVDPHQRPRLAHEGRDLGELDLGRLARSVGPYCDHPANGTPSARNLRGKRGRNAHVSRAGLRRW